MLLDKVTGLCLRNLFVLAPLLFAVPGAGQAESGSQVSTISSFLRLAPAAQWNLAQKTRLRFRSYHPQGLVKIGDRCLLSSVQVYSKEQSSQQSNRGEPAGSGHLFEFDATGQLLRHIRVGEGDFYHPGGIDFDGQHVWIPVAEYRPGSKTIVYRVAPSNLEVTEAFRVDDHIGGLAVDRLESRVYGVNWGSRKLYTWDFEGRLIQVKPNPSSYIDYQDCKCAGRSLMVCAGLSSYLGPDKGRFTLGGVEAVSLELGGPVFQIPVPLFAHDGSVMTRNPFFFELEEQIVRFYFIPEDDDSLMYEWVAPVLRKR